jgi:uncharacterized delta-60 repeat protein
MAAALVFAVLAPAAASADAGRTLLSAGIPAPLGIVDGLDQAAVVARPDGGAVLLANVQPSAGVQAVAMRADGTPDTTFGKDGVAHVGVPSLRVVSAVRRPDGSLLLAGETPARSRFELAQLVLVQLTPSGALDGSFGDGGVARPGIESSCEGCGPVALAPDGSIVVTGATGSLSHDIDTNPDAGNDFRWVVARLTPSGAIDPAFGVRPVPGSAGGSGGGYSAAVTADGRITLLGGVHTRSLVARLLPGGGADASFAGGAPAAVPVTTGLELLVAPNGAATVLGFDGLARLTPGGASDAGFGTAGRVPLANGGNATMATAPGGAVVVSQPASVEPRPATAPALLVDRIDASGTRVRTKLRPGFGGGVASFPGARRILPLPRLEQNAFRAGPVAVRPDGSYLVTGTVAVGQYSDEGEGMSASQLAAVALTPGLALDPTFGPGFPRPAAAVRLAERGSARGAYRRRGVLVLLGGSKAGLARVRVRDAHGRVLAQGIEPVYAAGERAVWVPITRAGLKRLRRGGPVRVRVTATLRDLLGATAAAKAASGILR